MEFIDIKERDGYMDMNDLPYDCQFNKRRTGSGGTNIAMRNDENYIIAVPTTELIINKCFPVFDEQQNRLTWDKKDIKAGLSPVRNLFGVYGSLTKGLERQLVDYYKSKQPIKIMATYDQIPNLMKFIDPKKMRLLVDEYHTFLKAYAYRSRAINGVLQNFRDFKSFCFMSATPIDMEFVPNALNSVPTLVADWKELEPLSILPLKTNKPYMKAAQIIKAYMDDGYILFNGMQSDEAYFFINSVTDSMKIIEHVNLTDDDCRIICADNPENKKKLKNFRISNTTDAPKKINFITSKAFEGADFYSDSGLCFVVSNISQKHTLLSIDMDIPQIAGRIRNKNNPFRNTVVHIFNTLSSSSFTNYDAMVEATNNQLVYAQERVILDNNLSEGARLQRIKEIQKIANSSYIQYDKKLGEFIVNDMLAKVELYNHKLTNLIYGSGSALMDEYQKHGILTGKIEWEVMEDDFIKNVGKKQRFLTVFNEYARYQTSNPLAIGRPRQIEEEYPFIRDAFNSLGVQTVRELRSKKNVEEAVKLARNRKDKNITDDMRIFKELKIKMAKELKQGFISATRAKELAIEIGGTKGTDLNKWFVLSKAKSKRIKNEVVSVYEISGVRMLFEDM